MRTRWPWITMLITTLAVLSPIGRDIIYGAFLSDSPYLREIAQPIAWTGMAILAAAVLLEWIVRTFSLKRRQWGFPEPDRTAASRAMRTFFTFFLALLLSFVVA